MHLLYCDESNLEEREDDFFVYGGFVVNAEAAQALSEAVEHIRVEAGVDPEFVLKFNPSPPNLSHQQFNQLKQRIIEAAIEHGGLFFSSLILHNIASSPDEARRNAINTICYHFDCYLHRPDSHGLVLVDRFDDKQIDAHLREKFSIGITGLPYTKRMRLSRVIGFHYSAIGQSHFGSVIDIVLGSFRFAVNAFTRADEDRISSARTLLRMLAPLFYSERSDGYISELSLFFSPKVIKSNKFRNQYEELKAFFESNGIFPEQQITNMRMY
ncbi:hypothetical protein T5B8_03115 [Salinisphaera sp. T5B8]|uniref:DUF3800 domain-containing protein n=1 Tax=Salinisphaera sp. T5B8 TaxID=1304154 RepID=UPI00333F1F1D